MCAGSQVDLGAALEQLVAEVRRRGRRCGCTTGGSPRSRAACRPSRRSWPSAGSGFGSPSRSPDSRSSVDHRLTCARRRSCRPARRTPRPRRRRRSHSGVSRSSRPSRPITVRTGSCSSRHQLHVGEVTERAAHRDAGALVHLRGGVGEHRDLDAEDRAGDGGAEQRLVALVVGVGDQRDHAGDQLGTGGLDEHRTSALVGAVEGHPVVVRRRTRLASSSACATAVWKVTSHRVGASCR